jgi:hypothetical protein
VPVASLSFKTVNELEPPSCATAARPADFFLARRTQVLSSAHARFVSGEYSRRPEIPHETDPSRAIKAHRMFCNHILLHAHIRDRSPTY